MSGVRIPPSPHSTKTQAPETEDEEDAVDLMLKKAGCLEAHYAVQECIVENKDWRVCQKQVADFKLCIENSKKKQN